MTNSIMALFPTADLLLGAPESDVERAVLLVFMERTDDPFRRMTTAQAVAIELFQRDGYPYDVQKRNAVDRAIGRASKKLEDAGLIEEPDADNGKNGYRVISEKGRAAAREADYPAVKTPQCVHTRAVSSVPARPCLEFFSVW